MPQTPKRDGAKPGPSVEPDIEADPQEQDQEHHEYYYDDAHGYETFLDTDEDDQPELESTREPGGIDEK